MSSNREVLGSIQRLTRSLKRRTSHFAPGYHGRGQGITLRLIAQNNGIIASELAKLLNIRPPSLTEKLNKLEKDGNIKRVRDVNDARVVHILITENGKKVLERRKKDKKKLKRQFSDCLTEEERQIFCKLCNRLSDNLDSIREEEKILFMNSDNKEEKEKGNKKEGKIG